MQKFFKNIFYYSFYLILLNILFCCSEKDYDKSDPAESFAYARESYDDENYEIAITRLGEFKSRFPYSKYAALAELYIANSHFELASYEEAVISYKHFVKLHPKHPQVVFAMYRIGESYWIDSPEDVDREQEFTHNAIEEWNRLIAKFPDSSYAKKANKYIALGQRRIAESHEFIADFYCKLDIYHACAFRFLLIMEKYPMYQDLYSKAKIKAAESLEELAKIKKEDPESDKNLFFKNYTVSQLYQKARELKLPTPQR